MNSIATILAFIGNIGWPEIIVLSVLGVLIFGRRLPEVGKSIGKGIVEFKKAVAGIDTEVPQSVDSPIDEKHRLEQADSTNTISTGVPNKETLRHES